MQLVPVYVFQTSKGRAVIAYNTITQRFHAVFDDEDLGAYTSAEQAVDDLSGGHTFWPSAGDPSTFGIPDELSEWRRVR